MYNQYPIFSRNLSEPLLSLYLPCLAMFGGSRNGGSDCGTHSIKATAFAPRAPAYWPEFEGVGYAYRLF